MNWRDWFGFRASARAKKDRLAMQAIRGGRGDVELIFVVIGADLTGRPTSGFECVLYQGRARHFAADPADAVLGAIEKFDAIRR